MAMLLPMRELDFLDQLAMYAGVAAALFVVLAVLSGFILLLRYFVKRGRPRQMSKR